MSEERKVIITPEFRLCFPQLSEPKAFEGSNRELYSVVMLFPKSADISEIKKIVNEAAVAKWPNAEARKKLGLKNPIRDGDSKTEEWGDEFKGHWFIRASSQHQPKVVDRKKAEIIDFDDVYSGCYARAVISAFAFDTAGNRGVAIGLDIVQKLKDGERIAGGGTPVSVLDDLPDEGGASTGSSSATESDDNVF
jgi:hypothetical protein